MKKTFTINTIIIIITSLILISIAFNPPSNENMRWVTPITRPLNGTTYTPAPYNPCGLNYTITISCTATIGSSSSGRVFFQFSLDGGSSWIDGPELRNSNTVSLAVVLNSTTVQTAAIYYEVPAGALCRMTSTSTGSTTITYERGTEIIM